MAVMNRDVVLVFLILVAMTFVSFQNVQALPWGEQVHLSIPGRSNTLDYIVTITAPQTLNTEQEQILTLEIHVSDTSEGTLGLTVLQAEISIKLPNGYELKGLANAPQEYYVEGETWTENFNFFFSDKESDLIPGSSVTVDVSISITESIRFVSEYSQLQVNTDPNERSLEDHELTLYSPLPAYLLVTSYEVQNTLDTDDVYKRDNFSFTITVMNVGERPARDVYASLKPPASMTVGDSIKSIGDLDPDEQESVAWVITPSLEGFHELEVELSSTTSQESKESFNIEVKGMKPESFEPYIPFLFFGALASSIIIIPIIMIVIKRPNY